MIQFTEGYNSHLSSQIKDKLFNYRYQVFVEQLGWDLNTPFNHEIDEFDHSETVYVIANDRANNIVGCARLLPTTLPYLLETIFPELLNGLPAPKKNNIWELSRFTSMDLESRDNNTKRQMSSYITEKLLKKSIEVAKKYGAEVIISVSPIGIERLLRSMGITSHRAGPPIVINGHPLIACWIYLKNNP